MTGRATICDMSRLTCTCWRAANGMYMYPSLAESVMLRSGTWSNDPAWERHTSSRRTTPSCCNGPSTIGFWRSSHRKHWHLARTNSKDENVAAISSPPHMHMLCCIPNSAMLAIERCEQQDSDKPARAAKPCGTVLLSSGCLGAVGRLGRPNEYVSPFSPSLVNFHIR